MRGLMKAFAVACVLVASLVAAPVLCAQDQQAAGGSMIQNSMMDRGQMTHMMGRMSDMMGQMSKMMELAFRTPQV